MPLTIGQSAPNFNIIDSEKKPVSLEQFKGKNVVLLFFPAAFTGVCTKEMCNTTDELAFYNNLNAQVLGISVDMPFSLDKFKEINKIAFPLLSDFNKEAVKAYDVMYPEWIAGLKGVAKRSVIIIDKEGKIRYSQVLEVAGDMPDFEAAKKALAELN